jgi:hypothetical protein
MSRGIPAYIAMSEPSANLPVSTAADAINPSRKGSIRWRRRDNSASDPREIARNVAVNGSRYGV